MNQVQYSQPMGSGAPGLPYQSHPKIKGDLIGELPFDQTVLSHNEVRIVDTLFKQQQGVVDKILTNSKDVLLVGTLFMIFSLTPIDDFLLKMIPIARNSEYSLLIVKAVLIMLVFFLLKNIHLVRK